jgi:hypothetical protein
MSRRGIMLANKPAGLEQIKIQSPNFSHRQLGVGGITGVPKSIITCVLQQQEELRNEWTYSTDSRELPTNGSVKVKIQMLKWLSIIGFLSQLDELSLSAV